MGHLVNPISLRLSINTFWNSNWILINNFNYINIFKRDFTLFHFLNWFIKKSKLTDFNIIISHYKIYRIHKYIYINLYYYNANFEGITYKYHVLQAHKLWISKNLNKSKKILSFNFNHIYKYIFRYLLFNMHWTLILNKINIYLKRINKCNDTYFFNVFTLNFSDITVESITKYISLKLQKKFSLDWVLFPVLRDLNTKLKQKNIAGFKILCSGRFTRKQIATYSWHKKGSLQLNTLSNLIRYSEIRVRLKYGLCGIKLWISYGNNNDIIRKRNLFLVYPNYLPFKYKIIINTNTPFIILFLNHWFFLFLRVMFFKSNSFDFYKHFIKIKINILLKNLIYKLRENYNEILYSYNYQLNIKTFNKINIFIKKKHPMINLSYLLKLRKIKNLKK